MVSGYRYSVQWTAQYKKDVKLAKRRQYDISELEAVIRKLANADLLDERYCDHALEGKWKV